MDLGPITGIRSIGLSSGRKAERDDSPRFEVDSSPKANDDAYSSSEDAPRDKNPENQPKKPQQVASQAEATGPEAEPDNEHNWFV
ncbi:MAG TPA: hypothetical protein VHW46_14115 [Terracidiphilus sp.]|jgi:hypothetical protein|nr:hypothetical protein [Terracidiphilus sp.]